MHMFLCIQFVTCSISDLKLLIGLVELIYVTIIVCYHLNYYESIWGLNHIIIMAQVRDQV